jgi:hypothetical protein
MRYIEFLRYFFWNSEFWNQNSDLLSFQQRNSKNNFRLESPESKTELEFCFQWGSQKLEPMLGISNLVEKDGKEKANFHAAKKDGK